MCILLMCINEGLVLLVIIYYVRSTVDGLRLESVGYAMPHGFPLSWAPRLLRIIIIIIVRFPLYSVGKSRHRQKAKKSQTPVSGLGSVCGKMRRDRALIG